MGETVGEIKELLALNLEETKHTTPNPHHISCSFNTAKFKSKGIQMTVVVGVNSAESYFCTSLCFIGS